MLDPELQDYVQRGVLCHPCVVSVSIDRKRACTGNAIANEQFRHTKAAILDAKQSGDWEKYVILHVRPYRLEALQTALKSCGQATAPTLVAHFWLDSENIWQNKSKWIAVWKQLRDPRATMDADDNREFGALPEEFHVYRGYDERGNARGLSWTAD